MFAMSSSQEMIKKVYVNPETRPDHIFFDNNCTVWKMVKKRMPDGQLVIKDPFFANIGLTVDIFHFKSKHKESDVACQTECNAADFPELQELGPDGKIKGWYFNSSVAEQTNAWIGGYISICREMHIDRYNFFLDEMIIRRNRMTLEKLTKIGAEPFTQKV
jgi:hypothetical protein